MFTVLKIKNSLRLNNVLKYYLQILFPDLFSLGHLFIYYLISVIKDAWDELPDQIRQQMSEWALGQSPYLGLGVALGALSLVGLGAYM